MPLTAERSKVLANLWEAGLQEGQALAMARLDGNPEALLLWQIWDREWELYGERRTIGVG